MTGTKKDREALKNRYRKGMYPTENDFADVFESYVHKDDDIPMSKVVITDGDGKTTTLSGEIDKKADKTTLQTFIDETETILQVVRNDNNQIASTAIGNLLSRIQAAEDDIDTAEDNISGHETRIVTLESSKTDYEAFKERVRAFLEDADASDATINRWHEIETFLQGITDTETLTGLLNDLKNEILAAIPSPQSGNFIEYTTDLDAITDAPNGKIMQYWGQSNDRYKRGQFYERVSTPLPQGQFCITLNGEITSDAQLVIQSRTFIKSNERLGNIYYDGARFLTGSERQIEVGDTVFIRSEGLFVVTDIDGTMYKLNNGRQIWSSTAPRYEDSVIYRNAEGFGIVTFYNYNESSFMNSPSFEQNEDILVIDKNENKHYVIVESLRTGSTDNLVDNTWQHIHVDEVIN